MGTAPETRRIEGPQIHRRHISIHKRANELGGRRRLRQAQMAMAECIENARIARRRSDHRQ